MSIAVKKHQIPGVEKGTEALMVESVSEPSSENTVVGVFETHDQADNAVKILEREGFSMSRLSIIGEGYQTEEKPIGFYSTVDRIKTWSGIGLFWGSLWGLLFGAAFFWIPGADSIALAGPFADFLVTTLEGAVVVGGVSGLGAALLSLGLPNKAVIKYQRSLKADRYLVIAHGMPEEVAQASELMDREKVTQTAFIST